MDLRVHISSLAPGQQRLITSVCWSDTFTRHYICRVTGQSKDWEVTGRLLKDKEDNDDNRDRGHTYSVTLYFASLTD